MAVRADSGIRWASVWRLLGEPSPGRLAFAARLALICTLVTIFAETYTTPEIALTVYLVFFLNKPDRMSSMALDHRDNSTHNFNCGTSTGSRGTSLGKSGRASVCDGIDFVRHAVSCFREQAKAVGFDHSAHSCICA